jgi:hypothetical protein
MNIALQQELKQPLPHVIGPCDYMEFRSLLEQIDHLLITSKIEEQFIAAAIEKNSAYGKNQKKLKFVYLSFRTTILASLTGHSSRELARRIADSELFRWFIGINDIDRIKSPSKSTIKRMEQIWSAQDIETLVHNLNKKVIDPANSQLLLNYDKPIAIDEVFADSTCINANIHYPVDWLLIRDAVRTLTASIILIRRQGIKHRMPEPLTLVKTMNCLAIEMTQCSRNRKGKKARKKIFRKMKSHLTMVMRHAKTYYQLLKEKWHFTEWSEKQTLQVLKRMSNVVEQIPSIITIAHTRIISEKAVENQEKILSLYEKNVHVIKRGKFGSDVEFGNGLYIAEQKNGIIIDFDYYKEYPDADTHLLKDSIGRIKEHYFIGSYSSDRGFNSKANDRYLNKEEIFNATCPRNPRELVIKMDDERFRKAQQRRAQTEGRIGILKNKFIGSKLSRKGYENRALKIAWTVFTHNLWVIARLAITNKKLQQSEALPAAA